MKHYWQTIPNWFNYQNLYKDMVNIADSPSIFVEVGSFLGSSAAFLGVEIVNSKKNIKLYAIDHFFIGSDIATAVPQEVKNLIKDRSMEEICRNNLEPLINQGIVNVIRGDSSLVADQFADSSVDFCFIDAAHDYDSVKRDMTAWWPKIKPGKIMAGHDWDVGFPGVMQAVEEFGKEHALPTTIIPPNSLSACWAFCKNL